MGTRKVKIGVKQAASVKTTDGKKESKGDLITLNHLERAQPTHPSNAQKCHQSMSHGFPAVY